MELATPELSYSLLERPKVHIQRLDKVFFTTIKNHFFQRLMEEVDAHYLLLVCSVHRSCLHLFASRVLV
uniref:Uncharacterized protein n=1 Tax=Solanum tuberosum TaxID=4113 RepID=M1CFB9_SOLTU